MPCPVVPVLGAQQRDAGQEYTAEETEFLRAMCRFQQGHRRAFPTFVDVLRVAKSLGYRREGGECHSCRGVRSLEPGNACKGGSCGGSVG